jgi:type IV secretion system protein VirB10
MTSETGSGDVATAAAEAQAAERERGLAELRAARQSGLLVSGRGGGAGVSPVTRESPPEAGATGIGLDPENDPNAQGRKEAFVGALDKRGDINPHSLTPAVCPRPTRLALPACRTRSTSTLGRS